MTIGVYGKCGPIRTRAPMREPDTSREDFIMDYELRRFSHVQTNWQSALKKNAKEVYFEDLFFQKCKGLKLSECVRVVRVATSKIHAEADLWIDVTDNDSRVKAMNKCM